jgi:hypothetical protein
MSFPARLRATCAPARVFAGEAALAPANARIEAVTASRQVWRIPRSEHFAGPSRPRSFRGSSLIRPVPAPCPAALTLDTTELGGLLLAVTSKKCAAMAPPLTGPLLAFRTAELALSDLRGPGRSPTGAADKVQSPAGQDESSEPPVQHPDLSTARAQQGTAANTSRPVVGRNDIGHRGEMSRNSSSPGIDCGVHKHLAPKRGQAILA